MGCCHQSRRRGIGRFFAMLPVLCLRLSSVFFRWRLTDKTVAALSSVLVFTLALRHSLVLGHTKSKNLPHHQMRDFHGSAGASPISSSVFATSGPICLLSTAALFGLLLSAFPRNFSRASRRAFSSSAPRGSSSVRSSAGGCLPLPC